MSDDIQADALMNALARVRAKEQLLLDMLARVRGEKQLQQEPQPQPQPPPAEAITHEGWRIEREPSGWYIPKGARNERDGRRCRYRDHIAPAEFTPEQVRRNYDQMYLEAIAEATAKPEPEMGAAQQRRMKRDIQRRMHRGF
ncbi:hypothetical protein [Neoroseomonas soli]|uniref:Uncharacterized protein n=1 Tax=Neoroseomonas soli TaxID=1081025 RepID=A0A9X9X0I6_9PROT|nr:hypothetical protein [Neoroseomonas soli]MBR0672915.1 hypothetical protein [Neoroseomonas soli]